MDTPANQWRKSSRSGQGNNCVEVAATAVQALVRDSKLGETGPRLAFSTGEWRAFLSLIKS